MRTTSSRSESAESRSSSRGEAVACPDHTLDELFAVLIARDLRADDGVIMVGANQPMARAGAALANMTRLPNARVILGLSVHNLAGRDRAPDVLPFLFDPRTLDGGEAWMRQHAIFDEMSWPDVFFIGGLQVDRRGNVNLLGIPSDGGGWRVRGPGALAQPTMSTYCRGYYVLMLRHEPRTFVERVACVTALGDRRRRRELGLPGGGPRLVLSPLGVFDFDDGGEMRVRGLHEGVEPGSVRDATGFELDVPDDVARTDPPTPDELRVLRERVDPEGTLRGAALP